MGAVGLLAGVGALRVRSATLDLESRSVKGAMSVVWRLRVWRVKVADYCDEFVINQYQPSIESSNLSLLLIEDRWSSIDARGIVFILPP